MYYPISPEDAVEAYKSIFNNHQGEIEKMSLNWKTIYENRPWWKFWQKRKPIGAYPLIEVEFKE